jgi:hypothetical protein
LFTKEFSVSTAPEVGRIIDFQNLPSSTDLAFLSITCRKPKNARFCLLYRKRNRALYIEENLKTLNISETGAKRIQTQAPLQEAIESRKGNSE